MLTINNWLMRFRMLHILELDCQCEKERERELDCLTFHHGIPQFNNNANAIKCRIISWKPKDLILATHEETALGEENMDNNEN